MANGGRPTKLNKQIIEEIALMVKLGNYIETASAFAGISKVTLYEWMKRGRRELERVNDGKGRKIRKSEELYVEFLNAIEQAMAEAEVRDVQTIYNATKIDWKASAWRLERKYPDRWGKTEHHEVSGKDGKPLEVEVARKKLLDKLTNMAESEEVEEE